jgi:hypothetical protein
LALLFWARNYLLAALDCGNDLVEALITTQIIPARIGADITAASNRAN